MIFFGLIKAVVGIAAGLGTSMVVSTAVKSITPADMGRATKVLWKLGGFGLAGVAVQHVTKYTNETLDIVVGLDDISDETELTVLKDTKET